MSKEYVFICGCPRSGTSALRHLLAESHEIVMGSERYAARAAHLSPELFERKRFLTQQPGDCGYDIYSAKFKHHDAGAYFRSVGDWFDDAPLIGDKIPLLYRHFDQLAQQFPKAKVIVTLRSIHEVASSYKRRANDAGDTQWSRGSVTTAIEDWNALFAAIANAPANLSIHLVPYRDFFLTGDGLDELVSFLGIERSAVLEEAHERHISTARRLAEERPVDLTHEELIQIGDQANFKGWNDLQRRAKARPTPRPQPLPKIIWTLWQQGWDAAPEIARASLTSWTRLNPSWKVNALTAQSLSKYLPESVVAEITPLMSSWRAAASDRIRIELLARYGGVWVDASTICAKPLDQWLPDQLESSFFAFEHHRPERKIASWFLAAKKGSYIIEQWRRRTENYWHGRREFGDYFWFHHLFAQGYASDPEWWRQWDRTPKLPAMHTFHFGPNDARLMGPVEQKYIDGLAAPPAWVFKLSHKQDKPIAPGSTMDMLARYGAGDWPNAPQPVGAPTNAKRLLVCWYGSFAGHGTIGDLRSLESAVTHLVGRGHDVSHATVDEFTIPGAKRVLWNEAPAAAFDAVLFVCGPILRTHPHTNALFERFANVTLIGLGVSILPAESPLHFNPFQILFARQGAGKAHGDIAIAAPPVRRAPHVRGAAKIGISLRGAQSEYGDEKCKWRETEALVRATAAAALEACGGYVVNIENHLQRSELTADGIDALYADCDLIITSRFHGAVMALRYNVPFIAIDQIVGGAKVYDLLAPLGWPHCYRIDDASIAQLPDLAAQLLLEPDMDALNDARTKAIDECAATFAELDAALAS